MKRMVMVPDQWSCKLKECPPGFFVHDKDLFLMSEYSQESYCSSGEYCHLDKEATVQPVIVVWEEYEE